ncbi:DUF397 domain-containing protein [Streptomyces sp. SAJ15]|nr:DUF397 domain-containing protein [Streptomyces sp. SAJ15]TVL87867.1 DUF397 domain-containing protein [Streptomyces sp. SAJ15]
MSSAARCSTLECPIVNHRPESPVPGAAQWRRSSYSVGMNNCVETAVTVAGRLAVRDSKRAAGPVLEFSPSAWSAFLTGLNRPAGPAAR